MSNRTFQIPVHEDLLDGLYDYFHEGLEIFEEEGASTEAIQSIKDTLAEIEAAFAVQSLGDGI